MKKIHRILALLLAALMAIGLMTTAFAATASAPIIDPGKKASLSIYKYDITKASNDGAWDVESYVSTGLHDDAVIDKLSRYAIQGVEFTYLRVADVTMNNEVVETRVPENVTSTCNPFFVSLPMTTIDGTAWNYDVTVYPKNQTGNPDLEKTVREAKNSTGKNTGSLTDIQKPSCDPPKTSNHQGRDFRPSLGGCPAVCRNRGGLMPAG